MTSGSMPPGITTARQKSLHDMYNNRRYPSIIEIKSAIPSYLFEPRIATSFYYVVKDLVLICMLYISMLGLESMVPGVAVYLAFPVYWYLQGTLMMGLFVLGHDCGHSSFSTNDTVNDIAGTLLHTLVLTPYYQWKLSHRHHHKNTGNMDKDEVFYPIRKTYNNGNGFVYLFGLGIGWFVYLFRGYHPRAVNHFNLSHKMFSSHIPGCTVSLLSLAGWVYFLYRYACALGFLSLLKYYVIPEMVFASWLLIVTFLHHTEEATPWYADKHWTYVKGQLSSVDRNYGWAHDVIHNIGTHQIHHLFSRIPHYNLEEATRHFRQRFPELVRSRDDRIIPSMFRMFRKFSSQVVISNETEIHTYK